MATRSKNSIVKAILSLRTNKNIPGTVRVKANEDDSVIDINFDGRKYIGRVRLEWHGDRFAVYLVDKHEGKIGSDIAHKKQVYLLIKTAGDAKKFIKWYELTTQLAALARTRA